MADEVEKKPEFVIHHKRQASTDKAPASPAEKKQKRVIIVKRAPKAADGAKTEKVRVVAKQDRKTAAAQKTVSETSDTVEKKTPADSKTSIQQTPEAPAKAAKSTAAPVKNAYDFNAVRPNVSFRQKSFRLPRVLFAFANGRIRLPSVSRQHGLYRSAGTCGISEQRTRKSAGRLYAGKGRPYRIFGYAYGLSGQKRSSRFSKSSGIRRSEAGRIRFSRCSSASEGTCKKIV